MMKKFIGVMRSLMCLVLAVLMLAVQLPAQAAVAGSTTLAKYGENYVVNASRLNVRSGPGMEYSVITGIKRGETVTYIKNSDSWWRVQLSDGRYGYVDRKYLAPVCVSKTGRYFVMADKLCIRKNPTTSSGIRGIVTRGTMVTITQLNGDWGYVSSGAGATGWVALRYLSSSSAEVIASAGTYRVIADKLNVRKGPSTSRSRIDTIAYGTQVKVLETDGEWGRITYTKSGRTKEGWVNLSYLKHK